MSAEEDFDLQSAVLRADGSALAISIEVMASKLEQALPELALVERRKVGGFRSKHRVIQRILLPLGEEQFELSRTTQGFQCTRHKVVRGITLSRQEIPMSDWINEVVTAVAARVEVTEQSRLALEGLLQ